MKTIHKFQIVNSEQIIQMPIGAEILSVGSQSMDDLVLWAMVDPSESKTETRTIEVFGTGWKIPDGERCFIGKAQTNSGLVFHFFEKNPTPQHGDE